jgi:hypothetical protein
VRGPQRAIDTLDAALAVLERDHLVVLPLDDLDGLLRGPDAEPFALRRGPFRAGIDEVALTLTAAGRLPGELTVRVVLPAGASCAVSTEDAQAALRQRANDLASASWRQATAIHNMGRQQMPLGFAIAGVSAVLSYAAAFMASVVDSTTVRGLCIVVAMVTITVAWVVAWMVVESSFIDWRESGRRARAYDLVARATLEVVVEEADG